MTVSERLAFLLSLDADGAIKGFEKVGNAADKNLGKTQSGLDRASKNLVSFGSKALAVGGLAVAGLANAANAAGDLAEAVAATEVIFGDASDSILEYGENAADSIGQSNRAALSAAATFGTFGKAAGKTGQELAMFSTDLVTLSSDLASFKNTSPEEAVEALGAALRGESEPIRKYGVLLDDATLKNRALELGLISTTTGTLPPAIKVQAAYAEILAQTTDAQGDFTRTADGLANSQRTATARMEDAKAAIGEGFLPILTAVTEKVGSLAKGFSDLNKSTGGVASQVLSFGVIGLGAAGALAFLAGKVIAARDAYTKFNRSLVNSEGQLTKTGKAVSFVQTGLLAFGATEVAFAVLNEITDASGKLERSLQKLVIATEGTTVDIVRAFGDLAKKENDVFRFGDIVGDMGKEIKLAGTESKRDIEDLDRAFGKLLETGPAQAKAFVAALTEQTDALDHNSGQYRDNIDLIERYTERLGLQVGATEVLSEQTDRGAESLGGFASVLNSKVIPGLNDTKTLLEQTKQRTDDLFSRFSDESSLLDLTSGFDDLRQSVWDTTVALNDQNTTQAENRANLIATRQETLSQIEAVLEYTEKVLEIPPSAATNIVALLDQGQIDAAENALAILTRNREINIDLVGRGAAGYGPSGPRALGGSAAGMTLVGERGPELVNLPLGSEVRNHAQLRADMSGASGGSTTVVDITVIMPPGSNGDDVVNAIRKYERTNGKAWRS